MLFKLLIVSSAMILTATSSAFAEDNHQTYKVRIPATSQTCQAEADALSTRFTRATGIIPLEAKCAGSAQFQDRTKEFTIYSLSLSYLAKAPLQPLSIKFGNYGNLPISGLNSTGDYYGPYKTYDSCLNDLDYRTLEFEEYTKLNNVASYCSKALASESYTLTIESFGKPTNNLYTFNVENIHADDIFQKQIEDLLISRGMQIVNSKKGRFYFYSNQTPTFVGNKLLSSQTLEICNSQIEAATNIVKGITSASTLLKCVSDEDFGEQKYNLIAIYSEGRFLTNYKYREKFLTFEECRSDVPRILEKENRYSGRAYFGALCSLDSSAMGFEKYKMELYSIL